MLILPPYDLLQQQAMTQAVVAAVKEVEQRPKTPGHVQILQGLAPHAPQSIDNAVDEVKSASAFWDSGIHKGWKDRTDLAVLVACFSDHPLTGMIRHTFPKSTVLNILEAGVIKALAAGQKFGIVTTTEDFVDEFKRAVGNIIGQNNDRFVGTFATGYTAIQLKTGSQNEIAKRLQVAAETLIRMGATVIILGCSGKLRRFPVCCASF
jgi:Asp/Glu/hydantoin racemase